MREIVENTDGSLTFRIDGKEIEHPLKDMLSPELYKARDSIRAYVMKNHKYTQCFLCGANKVIESHVIKREVLKTMAFDSNGKLQKLYTPTPEFLGLTSVFMEDKSRVSHAEAFTFKLICGKCDSKFSYESKSRSKEKYSLGELRSIALKIRLKELYDLKEKLIVTRYDPSNEFEQSLCAGAGSEDFVSLISDEEKEVLKIHDESKEFEVVIDKIIPYRVPFASEFFLAPCFYPKSDGVIERNVVTLSGTIGDMAPIYALIEPSSKESDKWSRVTVFIEKDDMEMRKWASEFLSKCGKSSTGLINELISYHIMKSAKNFVMRYDINKRFLAKLQSFRGAYTIENHRIVFNWVKAFKSKS